VVLWQCEGQAKRCPRVARRKGKGELRGGRGTLPMVPLFAAVWGRLPWPPKCRWEGVTWNASGGGGTMFRGGEASRPEVCGEMRTLSRRLPCPNSRGVSRPGMGVKCRRGRSARSGGDPMFRTTQWCVRVAACVCSACVPCGETGPTAATRREAWRAWSLSPEHRVLVPTGAAAARSPNGMLSNRLHEKASCRERLTRSEPPSQQWCERVASRW